MAILPNSKPLLLTEISHSIEPQTSKNIIESLKPIIIKIHKNNCVIQSMISDNELIAIPGDAPHVLNLKISNTSNF